MTDEASQADDGTKEALLKTIAHPVGHAILRVLTERDASAKELASALSQPRSTVRDQLRKLVVSGLAEEAGEEAKRGAVERFYRAAPSSRWLDDDSIAKLGSRQKRRTVLRVVREAMADTSSALASDRLDRRNDWVVASSRIEVDLRGWEELSAIHQRAAAEVERVRDECAERLEEAEESLRAISWILLLEMPEES